MEMPGWGDVSGSVLLGWHEKLTEVAGTDCYPTDRQSGLTGRRLVNLLTHGIESQVITTWTICVLSLCPCATL
ncbi:uncharacterized protein F5891DRAFT_1062416 [Suillus fuscotomentosus]|uniref:Uncharacterized protein n=1 Tax=Suillus fuscotomentosus TaxID=1912939 RepID=A0AAD4DXS9_9AGAM|nr:uncharacterized protein F5891DRAFT_1062416 [Suillus fuscotomentosus]KAG1894588.1 hypothetical protein F5891DRAFT_1062416 [Suillus fuscotomentosus]